MNTWHVEETALLGYRDRQLDGIPRASVEAHLSKCAACRAALARASGAGHGEVSFDRMWDRIETRVEDLEAGRLPGLLRRIGVRDADTVVIRSIRSQSVQWTLATALVLAVAALASALGDTDRARLAFVVLAPLLPPLGVAATFRFNSHSTTLLETTSPYSPARLLLWRTAYVVLSAVPVAVGFGAVIPGNPWIAVAWLLPCAACTLMVLAASTWTDPLVPATVVSGTWVAVVYALQLRDLHSSLTAPSVQLASLAVALAAALMLRRRLAFLYVPAAISVS